MCSFFYPKQNLLKPFFDSLHQLSQGSCQSYFIRAHLLSNFSVTLGLAGAMNRKMVLVNFVYHQKRNTFRHPRWVFFKKMSHPTPHSTIHMYVSFIASWIFAYLERKRVYFSSIAYSGFSKVENCRIGKWDQQYWGCVISTQWQSFREYKVPYCSRLNSS